MIQGTFKKRLRARKASLHFHLLINYTVLMYGQDILFIISKGTFDIAQKYLTHKDEI